jgi:Na+/H+ antiporter NhaD/arsenite permease-like protein
VPPPLTPAVLSNARLLTASLIFFGSYFVFALGKFPWMKIDRPGAAIIGAVLMVAFRIVGAPEALASIDFATIVLLFSMMIVVANLQIAGFFNWIASRITAHLDATWLLPAVIFSTGLLSAFLVNDVVCLVMTSFVIQLARRLGRRPVPYVLAVATASNIGSAATITGNPQNMLIGSISGMAYTDFAARLAPVAVAGLFLNWLVLRWLYAATLDDASAAPSTTSRPERFATLRKKPVVVLVIVLAGFLVGAPPALIAAIGAALMLVTRTVNPRQVYDEVDWGLLVFFVGLFIIVGGAERAGLVQSLLSPLSAWNVQRLPVFVAVTATLSNIVSNVPAVMLLRTFVPAFPDPKAAWLALSVSSTLAGNLTITGSVANIIVVERAAAEGVHIGFREYFRVGLPLTLATLAVAIVWLAWM